jgi:AcrR family transcriptional regulator
LAKSRGGFEVSLTPKTDRGTQTKEKILLAAERVFADLGYQDASVAKITNHAGVGQGTFYLYFGSKLEVFEELVYDLNRRVRRAMTEGAAHATTRIEREREGFRAFFKFTAEHPALYRIIRQAEFVSPKALKHHYTKIVEGYRAGIAQAEAEGEISDLDPEVASWMLMGIGELIGMRWVLWSEDGEVPEDVFENMMRFIESGLQRGRS